MWHRALTDRKESYFADRNVYAMVVKLRGDELATAAACEQ